MAVTREDLLKQDFYFQGRPFVPVASPGVNLFDMDYFYQGRPFVAPNTTDVVTPPDPVVKHMEMWFMMF